MMVMMMSSLIIPRMRNAEKKVVEKIKTHLILNDFFPENRAIYEIMWKIKNTAGQTTDDKMVKAHFILDT